MRRHRRHAFASAFVCGIAVAACTQAPAQPPGDSPTRPLSLAESPAVERPRSGSHDLALPPSKDVAAAIRAQDDDSAPVGGPVRKTAVTYSFARDRFEAHGLAGGAVPYAVTQPIARKDTAPHDAAGVRMHEIGGKLYEHPNFQAGYGIANLESYRLTGDRFYLDRATVQAAHLVERRVESRGAWYFPYTFDFRLHGNPDETMRAPWYSGLSQGKALTLFARMYDVTGEARWREAADRTFASFVNLPERDRPWVVRVDRDGLLWLIEYPLDPADRSDHVFNGHMSAIVGLWDYYRVTSAPEALALYDGAVTTMRRYAPVLRVPGESSLYCVPHQVPASNSYHWLHVSQFLYLWLMTGRSEFVHLADSLRDDNPGAGLPAPHVVDLAAGTYTGQVFDLVTGAVESTKRVTLSAQATSTTVRRMRIPGRGIYYRLASGPLAGHWVAEKPGQVMVRGPVATVTYRARRLVSLVGGRTYVGHRYDAAGTTVATRRMSLSADTAVEFDRTGWIAGARVARILTGRLAGFWVTTTGLRLD